MDREQLFAMCRRAQLFYNNTGDHKAYRRWKILEQRIIDEGLMEEYESWYIKNQDNLVKEWNRRQA